MKNKIHPEYNNIIIIMTDGTSYKTRLTYRKTKVISKLDMDTKSHFFWNEGSNIDVVDSGSQQAKFEKRFLFKG